MIKLVTKRILHLVFILILFTISVVVSFISDQKHELSNVLVMKENFADIKDRFVFAEVKRIIDGDTLKVNIQGKEETIRLIGINTPESVDPRTIVECFGKEASKNMKNLLANKNVFLENDDTQSKRDKYGRMLVYLYTEDGNFINATMIAGGYAFEYTYNLPYKYQEKFKTLESEARIKGLGIWDGSVCDYKSNPKQK